MVHTILLCLCILAAQDPAPKATAPDSPVVDRTIHPPYVPSGKVGVQLEYLLGGEIRGVVQGYNTQCIVVTVEEKSHVIPWSDLDVGSAYRAARDLLIDQQGGKDKLTGENHIFLGEFCLSRGNVVTARYEFNQAIEMLGPGAKKYIQGVMDQYNGRVERMKNQDRPGRRVLTDDEKNAEPRSTDDSLEGLFPTGSDVSPEMDAGTISKIMKRYDAFADSVSRELQTNLERIESDHFLIYTNWGAIDRAGIEMKAEDAYKVMCRMFGVPEKTRLFLGKCPIFCFRRDKELRTFARVFDHHDAKDIQAYSYMSDTGYCHIATYLRSNSVADYDRFSMAICHECCHVFLHRLDPGKPIRGWLAEGLANYTTEKALGNYSPYAESADILAWVYLENDIPVRPLFDENELVSRHYYPLAYNMVEYLIEKDPEAFIELLKDVKHGDTPQAGLMRRYGGMTFGMLERQWKEDVSKRIFVPEKTTFTE